MKKYQSSYVLKQIKKKRIFEKKIHMDFPYGFSIQLDTRDSSDVAKNTSMDKMCKYSQYQQVSNRSGIEAKSPSSIIFRRFGSLVDVSGTAVW